VVESATLEMFKKPVDIITEYHRIVGVGRDLCGSSSPTPLPNPAEFQDIV